MRKLFSVLMLSAAASAFMAIPAARAQDPYPYVIRSTRPISEDLREALDNWLANTPPSSAPYYIVTNTSMQGNVMRVSLVGVTIESPDAPWSFEDGDHTVWLGSVSVSEDWVVTYQPPVTNAAKVAAPSFANGGGAYLVFPFAGGTSAMYGPRGVHNAGYGTTGMVAVDLVSGDDMGATAAPPYVMASDAGTIDYVCDDGTSVAVRTHNATTGDYFVYAHMENNANLNEGISFDQGETVGSLVYGSFEDDCGWAEQSSNHYHLHWAIAPAGGQYQVGVCTLGIPSQAWQCGDDAVRVGGFLIGGGGYVGDGNDGGSSGATGTAVTDPTFWDYFLTGALSIIDQGIIKLLPSHQPFQYTYMVFNMVSLTLRLVWVFAASNVSFVWLWRVIILGFYIKAFFFTIWAGAAIFRTIKMFPTA